VNWRDIHVISQSLPSCRCNWKSLVEIDRSEAQEALKKLLEWKLRKMWGSWAASAARIRRRR